MGFAFVSYFVNEQRARATERLSRWLKGWAPIKMWTSEVRALARGCGACPQAAPRRSECSRKDDCVLWGMKLTPHPPAPSVVLLRVQVTLASRRGKAKRKERVRCRTRGSLTETSADLGAQEVCLVGGVDR